MFRKMHRMMLIFFLVDVFGALGFPEVGNAPAMQCKLDFSHQFRVI